MKVEEFFRRLMEFARSLAAERQRSVGERLTKEELAAFDTLKKPEMALTAAERDQVKKAARELLETLKGEKFVLDSRKRQQARAEVRLRIEILLDRRPPVGTGDGVVSSAIDTAYGCDRKNRFHNS